MPNWSRTTSPISSSDNLPPAHVGAGAGIALVSRAHLAMQSTVQKKSALLAAGQLIALGVLFVWTSNQALAQPITNRPSCLNNLRQLGQCFRFWSMEHGDRFPFNVSTNEGGTREVRIIRTNDLAADPVPHLLALTNTMALTTPLLLVCPQDHSKHPASSLELVHQENVTYRLYVGTNVGPSHPKEPLAVCPIDGNILYCDGTVKQGSKSKGEENDVGFRPPFSR